MATTAQFFNEDYEKCILGIMLLDNSLIDIISGRLSQDYFYNLTNRYAYEKICSLWHKDNCVTIMSLLNNDNRLKAEYVANLTNTIASTENWNFYVEKITEFYTGRKLKSEVSSIIEGLSVNNVSKTISDLETKILSFYTNKSVDYSIKELTMRNIQQVETAFKNKALITGFETGFEKLDSILDGFQCGNMYVLGARPSIGKTAFALSLIMGIAGKGVNTAVFSLEMSADSLYYRMVSSLSGIPMWKIKKGYICESLGSMAKYDNANQALFELPVSILDNSVDNDKNLYSRIRYEANINQVKVVFIDHLGLIEVSESSGQRYVDVGRITKTLHKMARELNICIVVLAQCGREAEGKRPSLNLLRESGNIEQDADVIMLLHRQRDLDNTFENEDPMKTFPTDVIVAKNRDGQTGTATFTFQPICMKFTEDTSGRKALGSDVDSDLPKRRFDNETMF